MKTENSEPFNKVFFMSLCVHSWNHIPSVSVMFVAVILAVVMLASVILAAVTLAAVMLAAARASSSSVILNCINITLYVATKLKIWVKKQTVRTWSVKWIVFIYLFYYIERKLFLKTFKLSNNRNKIV